MSGSFDRWLAKLTDFQRCRWAGQTSAPWEKLSELESLIDTVASDGLDLREAARCLCDCERAGLLYEERRFEEALAIARQAQPRMRVPRVTAEIIETNRELLLGNVLLIQHENLAAASDHFQRAIDAAGAATPLIKGNAAYNRGICLSLLAQDDEAIESYRLAGECYAEAGRYDKASDVLHAIGGIYRNTGRVDEGILCLQQAIDQDAKVDNKMGLWRTWDDLSRAYLIKSIQQPNEYQQCLEQAWEASNFAAYFGNEVWKTLQTEEARLADLSDQMLNFTCTRCDIAANREDIVGFLATLALAKGRIRLARDQFLTASEADLPTEIHDALTVGSPWAYLDAAIHGLDALARGNRVALFDQFVVRGELLAGYCVLADEKHCFGGASSEPLSITDYDPSQDLRGRRRAGEALSECQRLLEEIEQHGLRCSMLLGDDPDHLSESDVIQLAAWADELRARLERLGNWFFPDDVLNTFRELRVEHVVLCIDPSFARVPYHALVGCHGPIVDEPWTLSIVTASTELVRLATRSQNKRDPPARLNWFGPDAEVNSEAGGDREARELSQLCDATILREHNATRDIAFSTLGSSSYVHFRGHGRWTGSVVTSGPVFAQGEVLSSEFYNERPAGKSGFLFTAACLTGFGEPVGSELAGSLVDYDRAGLLGAVLTNWPIHGTATTTYTRTFYQSFKSSGNAAAALKEAAKKTRELMPHPYLWAPFTLIGAWQVGHLVDWSVNAQQSGVGPRFCRDG